MKSIRKKLLYTLLPGFAVLLAICGSIVYLGVSRNMDAQIDAELPQFLRPVRASLPNARKFDHRVRRESALGQLFATMGSGLYYTVWDENGHTISKSQNLGERELPRPGAISEAPSFDNLELDDEHLRIVKVVLTPRRREAIGESHSDSYKYEVVVAKNRDHLDSALNTWVFGLILGVVLVCALVGSLTARTISSGLQPLKKLAADASCIDARSLDVRFDDDAMPDELRPIGNAMNELLEKLEASFERERRFSSDLAHELRTPVAALLTMSESAVKWPQNVSPEDFSDVHEIATGLTKIIESMLYLARLEEGALVVSTESVNLKSIVAEHCQALSAESKAAGISIKADLPASRALESHSELLGIIISNLIKNGIEHAPRGSQIHITSGANHSVLAFSNPAPNLSQHDISHLFERLWRGDRARSGTRNSGLGLSIASSAAAALNLKLSALRQDDGTLVLRLEKFQA